MAPVCLLSVCAYDKHSCPGLWKPYVDRRYLAISYIIASDAAQLSQYQCKGFTFGVRRQLADILEHEHSRLRLTQEVQD
jgi:hypothetical protein